MSDWEIFRGTPKEPHDGIEKLEGRVPPWRDFSRSAQHRGRTYLPSDQEKLVVNAALHLRRPVLVTGPPGCGKSSLAYAIAEELKLAPLLKWPINSRSTLVEGLYSYDAVARLRDANLKDEASQQRSRDIRGYVHLQWLGTALASSKPRVLLIDEIDKADIDLPNDLLHVLEDGTFVIPELARIADEQEKVTLTTCEPDSDEQIEVDKGVVPCRALPIIVITSNGERELPLALNRRCLRLDIDKPDEKKLVDIVKSHLEGLDNTAIHDVVNEFINRRQAGDVMANDQLMNLIYLLFGGPASPSSEQRSDLTKLIFRGLDQ